LIPEEPTLVPLAISIPDISTIPNAILIPD
jgi:hypothetical protein